jgi:hypothetical protein
MYLFSAVLAEGQPEGIPPKILQGPFVVAGESDDECVKGALATGMANGNVTADNMSRVEVWLSRYAEAYARHRGE